MLDRGRRRGITVPRCACRYWLGSGRGRGAGLGGRGVAAGGSGAADLGPLSLRGLVMLSPVLLRPEAPCWSS